MKFLQIIVIRLNHKCFEIVYVMIEVMEATFLQPGLLIPPNFLAKVIKHCWSFQPARMRFQKR